ncbi:MAG: hemerythrin domain-containing protein [Myxococcota bacterium]
MAPAMAVIATWMQAHDALAKALRTLRRIWPEGDEERRRTALAQFRAPLELHLAHEEAVLLPAYAALPVTFPPNATARVLQADHDKLRSWITVLEESKVATSIAGILAEQEALCRLTGVLEHHDLREQTSLVPLLDAHIPEPTRQAWVDAFIVAEAALPPSVPLVPEPVPPRPLPNGPPLDVFRVAVAQDGPIRKVFEDVSAPDHPKGARLRHRCATWVDLAADAPTLVARRDALADLAEAARLLAIVASARGAA